MTLATTVLDNARAGRFAEIRELFAPALRGLVTPESLRDSWDGAVGKLGAFVGLGAEQPGQGAGVLLSRTPVQFEHGSLTVTIATDGEWVVGIQLDQPVQDAWTPPPYAEHDAFTEEEISLTGDGRTVPGTLTLPTAGSPGAGVVLLSGSGPHDRDETIGANKPFKDLAWGLASRGIAVLRAEKVTYTHGKELPPTFTLDEEYLPHATAAIALLRSRLPSSAVYIAGHSLGGTIAPRVALSTPVDGVILLAAGAQPLYWSAVRQMRYLATVEPVPQSAIDTLAEQASRVDGDLRPDTPANELPFGTPAPYWLSVRDCHPVEDAARLTVRMLIVNGGRDYQITVADDLALWRAGLSDHANVTIEVFEPGNHLLAAGSGPSTPAEYGVLQHVAVEVVDLVAGWIDQA
jgi:pimeloyl-ACP methyl ester carboxylesterase